MSVTLTKIEQYAVDGMLAEDKNVQDIYEYFPKEKKAAVRRHINMRVKEKEPDAPPVPRAKPLPYDKKAVLAKLSKAGIHGKDAERLIEKALPNVSSKPEVNELYNEAIRNIGPLELMIRKSEGGTNVSIMTPAASIKGEKLGKKKPEDYVFRPDSEA